MLIDYISSYPSLIAFKSEAHKGMADALNEQIKANERQNIPSTPKEIEEGYKHAKEAYDKADPDKQLRDPELTRLIIYFADRLLKGP
jgi:hypothetical protein